MSNVRSFQDRYIAKVATSLMLDDEINKMLYYNDVCDKDIYTLPKIKNPVKELQDVKVFCNRRVEKVFLESDISLFINLKKDSPYTKNGKKSVFFETLTLEIGVICHNACRKTLNGARESIVFDRIQYILKNTDYLRAISSPKIIDTSQIYNIPLTFDGYILTCEVRYFSSW